MTASAPHAVPGPRGTWPFGSFFDEAKYPLGFIQENQRRYGDVFLFRIGGRVHCVLSHQPPRPAEGAPHPGDGDAALPRHPRVA